MSATEELRRMLDERGVEYECDAHESIWNNVYYERTSWNTPEGQYVEYTEPIGAKPATLGSHTDMGWDNPTPQQAIDATLGRGTCRIEEHHGDWYCTGCGEMVGTCDTASELCIDGNAIDLWNFCPNCGRKVANK